MIRSASGCARAGGRGRPPGCTTPSRRAAAARRTAGRAAGRRPGRRADRSDRRGAHRPDRPSGVADHVSVPSQQHVKAVAGVWLHRRHRSPVAAPSREPARTGAEDTVVDLTQTAKDVDTAVGWIAQACARRLTTPERLRTAFAARRRLHWRDALTAAVADVAAGCHSVLELRYLRDVERAARVADRHPATQTAAPRATTYSDVEYEPFGLVVELDGRAAHDSGPDPRRDQAGAVRGRMTLRFGWTDVHRRSCRSAAAVAVLLLPRRLARPADPRRPPPTYPVDPRYLVDRRDQRTSNPPGSTIHRVVADGERNGGGTGRAAVSSGWAVRLPAPRHGRPRRP